MPKLLESVKKSDFTEGGSGPSAYTVQKLKAGHWRENKETKEQELTWRKKPEAHPDGPWGISYGNWGKLGGFFAVFYTLMGLILFGTIKWNENSPKFECQYAFLAMMGACILGIMAAATAGQYDKTNQQRTQSKTVIF